MLNKNGLSSTISSLLRCQDSIYDAIYYWSGNEQRLRKDGKLDYVDKWLKGKGCSIYEFLIYLTHYSVQETAPSIRRIHKVTHAQDKTSSMHLLKTPNAWVNNKELMRGFYEWKIRRTVELEIKYKVIKEDFRSYVNLYGEDMIYNILEKDYLRAGPVFTLDIALCNYNADNVDIPKITDQCMPWANMVILGCPEYLHMCHYLTNNLEENKYGITDTIFSGD